MNMGRGTWKLFCVLSIAGSLYADNESSTQHNPPDTVITEAVEAVIEWDESAAAHYVDVDTKNGVVWLSGYVDNILARERVEKMTAAIKGVRAIIDKIKVRPVSRSDQRIRWDIISALSIDPVSGRFDIAVLVKDGFVALEGNVGSYAEKRIAESIAKEVAGVVGVRNDLAIHFNKKYDDGEILALLRQRYALDPDLSDSDLKLSIDAGKVTVRGTLPTVREFATLQKKTGEVPGVREIDLSGLKVLGFSARRARYAADTLADDERIRLTLGDIVRYSPRLVPFVIEYAVDSGKVYLSGNVDNLMSRRIAERNAASIIGVRDVVNEITVEPTQLREDWELEKDVENRLKWDPYIERHAIDVWVNNGMVYLYGTVDNEFEKEHAEEMVSRIQGVAAIKNNLTLQDVPWPQRSDRVIEGEILKRLESNDRVSGKNIAVNVVDGIVTLSGKVETWKEYLSALNCAFSGGARGVHMEIEVRNEQRYFRFSPRYYPYGYPYRETFGFSIPF